MAVRNLSIPMDEVAEFCRKWSVAEMWLFGSVLRDDFRPDSDVDILVTFAPPRAPSLLDLPRMEEELSSILGRKVDLVERSAVERSPNYIRRNHILDSLERLYVA